MDVTRITDAKPYEAARHWDMTALRLQGLEASPDEEAHPRAFLFPAGRRGGEQRVTARARSMSSSTAR